MGLFSSLRQPRRNVSGGHPHNVAHKTITGHAGEVITVNITGMANRKHYVQKPANTHTPYSPQTSEQKYNEQQKVYELEKRRNEYAQRAANAGPGVKREASFYAARELQKKIDRQKENIHHQSFTKALGKETGTISRTLQHRRNTSPPTLEQYIDR